MDVYYVWTADMSRPSKSPVAFISKSYKNAERVKDNLNLISKLTYNVSQGLLTN